MKEDAVGLVAAGEPTLRRWTRAFLMLVGIALLAAGLARAAALLGVSGPLRDFFMLPPVIRSGLVALIFIDILAAVGLWIGAAWGPMAWIVAMLVELTVLLLTRTAFGAAWLPLLVSTLAFAAYLALTFVEWRRERATG